MAFAGQGVSPGSSPTIPVAIMTIGGFQFQGVLLADSLGNVIGEAAHPLVVSGTVAVSGSVAVTGALTDAQLRATPVPTSPSVIAAATSAIVPVAASVTSVTILVANATRKGMMVTNDSTATLYLKFGATASATSYTARMVPGAYFEHLGPTVYTGIVTGIWSAANGNAVPTELT